MASKLLVDVPTQYIPWILTGFFFILALAGWTKLARTPKRYVSKRYVTEIPAKMIIEEDSSG